MNDTTTTTYRILYRILAVASGQHLVVVSVLPGNAADEGSEVRSESRLFGTAELAAIECGQMVEAMRVRLVAAGHAVTLVAVA